jgi:hypothetical protein
MNMRRRRGWEGKCEGEGGRGNLRLDGAFPALSFTAANFMRSYSV